jgi:ribokinase
MSAPAVRLVCIGDVMVDVLARLPGPLAHGSDTPSRISLSPGGSGANTACWAAAAGAVVAMVGRVGDDATGRAAIQSLVDAGVEPWLAVDASLATGMCIVLIGPDGERTMIPDDGANAGLRAGDLPTDLLRAGTAVHVSAYTLLRPATRDAALSAMRLARAAGGSISVDASSAAPLGQAPAGMVRSWLPHGATLFANAQEAAVLSGIGDARGAARALADDGLMAVVKAGPDGVYACEPNSSLVRHCPAYPAHLVDSTGAGDAFAAGYLVARLAGQALGAALAAGAALGAQAVGSLGARPSR